MEKITNTTKYTKIILSLLVAVAFSVSLPIIAQAQYNRDGTLSGSTEDGYPNDGALVGSTESNDYINDGPLYGSTEPNGSTIIIEETTHSYPMTSGGYINYGSSYRGGYYYSIPAMHVMTSGGYTIDPTVIAPAPVYVTPMNTMTSGGFTVTSPAYVPPTTYYTQPTTTYIPNQVLAYTDTNPNLDSVYLSDVPYTGFSDYYGILMFISLIVSWSAVLAYIFLKRKIMSQMIFANAYSDAGEVDHKKDPVISDFVNQMNSDSRDIREVEEYARMQKVLLSEDAATKIIKIQRLGKGSAKNIINRLSKNEWVAIGESDIEEKI